MRAIYINKEISSDDKKITISGNEAHHLISVVRVRIHDEILLLNGKGLWAPSKVLVVTRKEVELELIKVIKNKKRLNLFDVGVGVPKKDAFNDCLRIATEVGVNTFIPLQTEYSQSETIKEERIEKLLESACIQANAVYVPTILKSRKLDKDLLNNYDLVLLFCERKSSIEKLEKVKVARSMKILILIGPEGGFSNKEIGELEAVDKCHFVHFETNIMRTPTALAAATGWLLSKFYK